MNRILFTLLAGIIITFSLEAQEGSAISDIIGDSLSSKEIVFTPNTASSYIENLLQKDILWKPESDTLKKSLSRLINQHHETYDSVIRRLSDMKFYPEDFQKVELLQNDTLDIKWLNDSTFIFDTVNLGQEPVFVQKTIITKIIDSLVLVKNNSEDGEYTSDSIIRKRDTIFHEQEVFYDRIIDTALLKSEHLQLYQIRKRKIAPRIFPPGSKKTYHFFADGSKLIISKPVTMFAAKQDSPLNFFTNDKLPDSLSIAIETLLTYTNQRDSIPVYFNTINGVSTQIWLTPQKDELQRYWIRNRKNDSVSIWMGNTDKSNIVLFLEDDIRIERFEKEAFSGMPLHKARPQFKLAEIKPMEEIPIYWDYNFSSAISLSENYISHWAKGGESSISSLIDIKGDANYTNEAAKTEWTNSGRLKYGSIISGDFDDHQIKKNTDLLQFDSKYNKSISNKIDFSAILSAKSQIAEGFTYSGDTTTLVSKFLNPGTFTIGVGFEYTPIKKSTVNFSFLSYKNTFVFDTDTIDQTNYGIDEDKRAKQEMGGQLLITNELTLFDDLKINNSLLLFSNYIETPQNIDVEWELDLQKQLSLYFTITLNIHLIYDDDILTPKLDDNNNQMTDADGEVIKIPQLQTNQFLGLTFLVNL